jgi:hypothetical protein
VIHIFAAGPGKDVDLFANRQSNDGFSGLFGKGTDTGQWLGPRAMKKRDGADAGKKDRRASRDRERRLGQQRWP